MAFQPALILRGFAAALALTLALPAGAQQASGAERRTAAYFKSVQSQPPLLWAFLKDIPKGGDLHSHLSGAVYAESLIAWAADSGACVDQKTLKALPAPCNAALGQVPAGNALTDGVLYRRMIDAWSMRNAALSGLSGHDQFFDTFGKFSLAGKQREAEMLAEVAARAGAGKVSYLELMLTPAADAIASAAGAAGWNDDLAKTHAALMANGLPDAVKAASAELASHLARQRQLLHCGTPQADAGCDVAIRVLFQVSRGKAREIVFAQMIAGFELAQGDPNVVGLNMVQPEDGQVPMRDFALHMRMLDYLHRTYPNAGGRVTLHAGELAPGLVPPEGLRFHIRDSIDIGHARRIGHGVDVMQEDNAVKLLRQMARQKVMVEICLSSNDGILGVSGARHPLATYLKYGVPVALATDDEGVSRSEMTNEYLRAVLDQHIGYRQLKTMARNSLHYSFAEGGAYWSDLDRLRPAPACAGDRPAAGPASARCAAYLEQNTKARLQRQLEASFTAFESRF